METATVAEVVATLRITESTHAPGARIQSDGAAALTRFRASASVAPTTSPTLFDPFQLHTR